MYSVYIYGTLDDLCASRGDASADVSMQTSASTTLPRCVLMLVIFFAGSPHL